MNTIDSLIMKEEAKYISAADYIQGLADRYDTSICSAAVITLQGYEEALEYYRSRNAREYNYIYIKEHGVYSNLTTEDAGDKEFLNFFKEAARMHNNEKIVLNDFREKYKKFYLLKRLPLSTSSEQSNEISNIREKQGDSLLILGAVMNCIKEISGPKYTQDCLIDTILNNYNIRGLSKGTLSKKFSEAKKYTNKLNKTGT